MSNSIFITGTDTNVGKTIVSAWLMINSTYSYWKPIQTGTDIENDTTTVAKLSHATSNRLLAPAYSFPEPLSPHLAAKTNNITIDLDTISNMQTKKNLIIEGAGGILTPLNEQKVMLDLIRKLKTRVLVVSRGTLGAINHASLTLQVLNQAKVNVKGVIVVGKTIPGTVEAICHYGKTNAIMQLPWLSELSYGNLKQVANNNKLREIL